METDKRAVCAECERLQAQVEALQGENTLLREQLARARKDSSTSSKPPSSDIVKPPKPPGRTPVAARGKNARETWEGPAEAGEKAGDQRQSRPISSIPRAATGMHPLLH